MPYGYNYHVVIISLNSRKCYLFLVERTPRTKVIPNPIYIYLIYKMKVCYPAD